MCGRGVWLVVAVVLSCVVEAGRGQTIADVYNELVSHRTGYLLPMRDDIAALLEAVDYDGSDPSAIGTGVSRLLGGMGYYNQSGLPMVDGTLADDIQTLITNGVAVNWVGLHQALGYDGDPGQLDNDFDDLLTAMALANSRLGTIQNALDPFSIASMAFSVNAIEGNTDEIEGMVQSVMGSTGLLASGLGYDGDPGTLAGDMATIIGLVNAGDPGGQAAAYVVEGGDLPGAPVGPFGGAELGVWETSLERSVGEFDALGSEIGARVPDTVWSFSLPSWGFPGGVDMPAVAFDVDLSEWSGVLPIVNVVVLGVASVGAALIILGELRK